MFVAGLAVAGIEDDGGDVVAHPIVDVADQAAVVRQADGGREEALRDAEGVVGLPGLAPLGNDVALVHDQAGLGTAHREGADGVAEWLAAEGAEVVECEVAGGPGLARDRDLHGALDGRRVEAGLFRGAALPVGVTTGEVRLGGEEGGGGEHERRADEENARRERERGREA